MKKNLLLELPIKVIVLSLGFVWLVNTSFAQSNDPDNGLIAAFTEDQVALGLQAYQVNCANGCHQADLSGAGNVPILRDIGFLGVWGNLSTSELFESIKTSMPSSLIICAAK